MSNRKDYKQTEIGRIPKEWKVVRLGELKEIELIMGQSPPGKSYNREGKGFPFIQGKAEFGSIYPTPILWTSQPTKVAEKGDILISVRAPVGEVNICPYRLCIGRGLAAVRIMNGSNMFYFYWFQKEKQRIKNFGKGSTFKAITKDELSNLLLPLPPLPEQKKIAEILSTVDEAIEKVDEAIARTERLKKGLMQNLLTKGVGHKDFKDTEIGRIPKEWEVVELGTYIDVFSGYAFKSEDFLADRSKGVPIIKIGNLQNGKVIVDDKTSFVPGDFYENLSDFQLHYGDVLIALSGATTGKIAVVDRNIGLALVNQRVGKFKILNSNILQKFFYFLAQSDRFKRFVLRNIGQSAQGNLSPNQVKKLKLPLPPLPEQKEIAEILSTVDKRLELLRNKKEKLERIKKGLMNDLLTGKKRVKLEA